MNEKRSEKAKELKKQFEVENTKTFGWIKDDLPKSFDFPPYVQERVDWVIKHIGTNPFLPMLTVDGAIALLLDWHHEDELRANFEEGYEDEWKPFTKEYKDYMDNLYFGDLRQIRAIEAIIFASGSSKNDN